MSRDRRLLACLALGLGLVAAGCGGDDPTATPPSTPTATTPDVGTPQPDAPTGIDEDSPLGVATGQAVEQAAADAGVPVEDVEVVTAEEVTWRDGALGCPDPDMSYTQALVEGFRIVVEVDGERVHYHADEPQDTFRCDDPEDPAETG